MNNTDKEPIVIKASTNLVGFILWTIVFSLLVFLSIYLNKKGLIYIIFPFLHFVGINLRNKLIKYELSSLELVVKVPFQPSAVQLNKVRSYTIEKNGFVKRYLLGYPHEIIALKYNRFDDLTILTTDKILQDKLSEIINAEK